MADELITGATFSTYMLQPEDVGFNVYCRVRGTNTAGFADANSNVLGPVAGAPAGPGAPATTNLYSWVKAGAGVFSDYTMATPAVANGEVLGWKDQKGSANKDWINTEAGKGPILKAGVVNGKPALHFTATPTPAKALLCNFDPSTLTSHELFIVIKAATNSPSAVNGSVPWSMCQTGENTLFPFYVDGNVYEGWGTTVRKSFAHPAHDVATQFRLYNIVSIAGEYTVFIDGTQIYTTATNAVGAPGFASAILGGFDGSAFNGDIAEIVWYSAKCSAPDKTTTKAYLAGEYALTVA